MARGPGSRGDTVKRAAAALLMLLLWPGVIRADGCDVRGCSWIYDYYTLAGGIVTTHESPTFAYQSECETERQTLEQHIVDAKLKSEWVDGQCVETFKS